MKLAAHRAGLAALLALLVLTLPAGAHGAGHPFLGVATSGPPAEPFSAACGVAVDSKSNLYVSNYRRGAIDVFSVPDFAPTPLGPAIHLTEIATAQAENSSCQLALDSADNLYANNLHQSVVKYPAAGFSPALTIDDQRATGVAVDRASDVVYVAHRTYIAAYDPSGQPILSGGTPLRIGLGSLDDAYGLAVSGFTPTQGSVYVADAADDTVKAFDPSVDPLHPFRVIDGAATPQGGFRELTDASLAIDDFSGHLFVLDNLQPGSEHPTAVVYEFDEVGTYLGQLPKAVIHGGPSGLDIDNSKSENRGVIYVTSGNAESSAVYAFCPTGPFSDDLREACASAPSNVLQVSKPSSGEGTVVSSPPGIDCGAICVTEFDADATVTLFATPRVHSLFTGWSLIGSPGVCPGSTGRCELTIDAETEVIANFIPIPKRTLTVTRSGAGVGTVSSTPVGLGCGSVCSAGFDQGTQVTLSTEAAPGSEFAGWSGGCSGIGPCKVDLRTDVTVDANFRPIERLPRPSLASGSRTLAISVSGSGGGKVSSDPAGIHCGVPCSGTYAQGTRVTLSAQPDSESRFSGWNGCDGQSANSCVVTLSSSRIVSAAFEQIGAVELGTLGLRGARATLKVTVPGPGTLTAAAKKLKPATLEAKRASTLTLPLALTKPAKKALAREGKLKVRVSIVFKPSAGGAPTALETTVPFKAR